MFHFSEFIAIFCTLKNIFKLQDIFNDKSNCNNKILFLILQPKDVKNEHQPLTTGVSN